MTQMTADPRAADSRKMRWALPIVIALLLAGAIYGAIAFRYDFYPKRFGVVDAGSVYRSGQISPRMIRPTLEKYHIASIIDLQGQSENPGQAAEQQAASELGIAYNRFPLAGDGTGKIENYAAALQTLVEAKKAGKPVLIHCSAGTQRTGVAVAYYRMLVEGRSPLEALDEMEKYGWSPTHDAKAHRYVNEHMSELAQILIDRGVIERAPTPLPQLP